MWVPSSVGSLHRAHWQLKRNGFKIRVVIDVTIVMLGVFLLEEPVLGDISSSSEVANGRRDVPWIGAWVQTWIIWFVTWRCDMTSLCNKYSPNWPMHLAQLNLVWLWSEQMYLWTCEHLTGHSILAQWQIHIARTSYAIMHIMDIAISDVLAMFN